MNRMAHVLQQLQLLQQTQNKTIIDIDLMLDYTRVLYADLLEEKAALPDMELSLPEDKASLEPAVHQDEAGIISEAFAENSEQTELTAENVLDHEAPKETVAPQEPAISSDMERKAISFEPPSASPQYIPEAPKTPLEETTIVSTTPELEEKLPPSTKPAAIQGFSLPKDIRKTIGLNDKYLYLNELFNNHKSNYEETLDRLSGLDNYQQAEEWLWAAVAKDNHWEKEDTTVGEFFTMLQKFFSSR